MAAHFQKCRITRAAFCFAIGTASLKSAAFEVEWTPRTGPLTCEQETEIELVSQELSLTEYRTMTVGGNSTPVFDAEAKFLLKNSSLAKKKPTIFIPLCTLSPGRSDPSLCDIETLDLKVALDGTPFTGFHIVRQNQMVAARFSTKFSAKMRREITLSYRLIERFASRKESGNKRPYATFEYHLEDSTKWKGKVGYTRISVKMPYRATPFNMHLLSAADSFRYKNRIAYLEKRRLAPENADTLTFFVVSPLYREKVQNSIKKVKALPKSVKRRIRLINLLAEYPGASADLTKHLDIVLKSERADWDVSMRKHVLDLVARYLNEALRFEDEGVRCEDTTCIERDDITRALHILCDKDDACIQAQDKRIGTCCSAMAASTPLPLPAAIKPVEDKSVSKAERTAASAPSRKGQQETLLLKTIDYFVAHWPIFLAIIIIVGWIGIASRSKKTQKMKELE